MGRFGYIIKSSILVVFLLNWVSDPVYSQEIESKPVRILINNLSDDKTPPTIKLMTPSFIEGVPFPTDQDVIDLIGEVTDQSGVKFVSVNSDIRSVNDAGIFSTRLQLDPGENKIRLMAADVEDNIVEKYVTVWYKPPEVTLSDKINQNSTYYGLIIGIDQYADPDLPDLTNPIKDAGKLKEALVDNYTFDERDIVLLENPDRDAIVYALDDLSKKVTPDDNVLIFYAGHGHWDERSSVGYWFPSDAYMSNKANWFRNSTLVDYLKEIESKHTLLITDACFAGSIFQTRSGFAKPSRAYEMLYDRISRKAMTSGELSEVPDRSFFTRYLVERLMDNEEIYLSSEQLFSSFRIAVMNNSDTMPLYGEIRNVGDEGGDFIFLKKKAN